MATLASEPLPDSGQRLSVSPVAAASSLRRLAAACDECDSMSGHFQLWCVWGEGLIDDEWVVNPLLCGWSIESSRCAAHHKSEITLTEASE